MAENVIIILVVEDEALIRFGLVDSLQDRGYQVIEAANVLQSLAILAKRDDIDVIITDIDMPGVLSGLDLVKMTSKKHPHILNVITSGRDLPIGDGLFAEIKIFTKPYIDSEVISYVANKLFEREKTNDLSKHIGVAH